MFTGAKTYFFFVAIIFIRKSINNNNKNNKQKTDGSELNEVKKTALSMINLMYQIKTMVKSDDERKKISND